MKPLSIKKCLHCFYDIQLFIHLSLIWQRINSSVSFFVIGHFKMIHHYSTSAIVFDTFQNTEHIEYLYKGAYLDTALKRIHTYFVSI